MDTTIAYVLTANAESLYIQQLILSLYSLRRHNPDCRVVVVTDNSTAQHLSAIKHEDYKAEIIIESCPNKLTLQQKSRYLKTSLRRILSGNFLFIDTDTIICENISDIDHIPYDIAAVRDKHQPIETHPLKHEIFKWGKRVGWEIEPAAEYFTSGVMYVKDTTEAHNLYRQWHETWRNGIEHNINLDQPALGLANYKLGGVIHELSGEWNCQITDNGLKYLEKAKILHYFASMQKWDTWMELPFILRDSRILEEIREHNNSIPDNIKQMIATARQQFRDDVIIFSGRNVEICRLRLFRIFRRLYFRFPKLINGIDRIISAI